MKTTLAFAALILFTAPLSAAQPITGRWITEDRTAVVEIAPCGTSLCGRIVKFLTPPKDGPDQRDIYNTDPSKRSRRIMGLAVLTAFTPDGKQWRGQIYDPRNGKTYRSIVVRSGANGLTVKGCIGPFCRSQSWRRES